MLGGITALFLFFAILFHFHSEDIFPFIFRINGDARYFTYLLFFVVCSISNWLLLFCREYKFDDTRKPMRILSSTMDASILYLTHVHGYPDIEKLRSLKCTCIESYPIDALEEFLKDFLHMDKSEIEKKACEWIDDYITKCNNLHETLQKHIKESEGMAFSITYQLKLISKMNDSNLL